MKQIILQNVNETGKLNSKLLNEMEEVINELAVLNVDELEGEEFFDFNDYLNELIKIQQEDGSFPLVIDKTIPSDCYYWYVARPTYVILRVLIAYGNAMHYEAIRKCLNNYCKQRTFAGHGYDDMSERIKNVTMLMEVNVESLCDEKMREHIFDICKNIRQYLLDEYIKHGRKINEDEQRFLDCVDENSYVFYGTLSKDEMIHDMVLEQSCFVGKLALPCTTVVQEDGILSVKQDENMFFKNIDLYFIDETDVNNLDEYEGDRFTKKKIYVAVNEMLFYPYIYVLKEYVKEYEVHKVLRLF